MKSAESHRLPSRKNLRLPHHDYSSSGAYFITIVSGNRLPIFGHIDGGLMVPSNIGVIIEGVWRAIPAHFPFAVLDAFALMPNHIHGIIVIEEIEEPPLMVEPNGAAGPHKRGAIPGSLSVIVQNFKSISTRKVNQLSGLPGRKIWQRNYYERVIRNDSEWQRTRDYIINNPMNWERDPENNQSTAKDS